MKDVLFRLPLPSKVLRPAALKPQDPDRIEDNRPGRKGGGKEGRDK